MTKVVKDSERESNEQLIRKFTRKWRSSGTQKLVKGGQFFTKGKSKNMRKKAAEAKRVRTAEIELEIIRGDREDPSNFRGRRSRSSKKN